MICPVCSKPDARIVESGWGSGQYVKIDCPDCKSTGTIGNMAPWYGNEMPLDKLRGYFAVAGFKIIGEPLKLQNRYWQGHDKQYYHPWWFVRTEYGWIEIGWRKRVISINWEHTSLRHVVTADDVTKGNDHVHAHSELDAIKYLTDLHQYAALMAPVVL